MNEIMNVYWGVKLVGRLWLDEKRNFIFQYDKGWLSQEIPIPISVQLPLQSDAFVDSVSKPFFSNLLPEATIRELIAKVLGVSVKNEFRSQQQ